MLIVLGSINLDVAIRVPRLPRPGETLLGREALLSPGGKGANQAHAARLFGVPVMMIGCVGQDAFAEIALSRLRSRGVDTSHVAFSRGSATGMATIAITDDGENAIVVAPGANEEASDSELDDALLRSARVVLLQMEVPWRVNERFARRARAQGCTVLLNASPLRDAAHFPEGICDTLIVNRGELQTLCAAYAIAESDPAGQARALAQRGTSVITTLGEQGAILVEAAGTIHRAASRPASVVDTTGAGDTFAGVYGAALALGSSAAEALHYACAAASLACERYGTQTAQPTREEIMRILE
jgi:ribokinase